MNNVPAKLRKQWALEDLFGIQRICMRTDEGDCDGRITKEHAVYYAGRQIQEEWGILDICAYHAEVDEFQDGGGMNKEKHEWIALSRAPEARLRELSKGEDKIARRDYLNSKYGIWMSPMPIISLGNRREAISKQRVYQIIIS